MKLDVESRSSQKKSDAKKLRRKGDIPAILYSKGMKGINISVKEVEFRKILNVTPTGTLSSKIFTLTLDGKKVKAIVKEIQYHVATYAILHIDFEQLHDDTVVLVKIPVVCSGIADCVGVKLGGVLRQVIRQVKVRALPKDIPNEFSINVRDLGLGQTKRLDEIKMPAGVLPVTDLKEVAVVIGRR